MPSTPIFIIPDDASAASPAAPFTSSPGTGFFNKGTNSLGFSANGVECANYNASGNWSFAKAVLSPRANVASAATIASLSSTSGFVKLTGSTATDLQGIAAGSDGQTLRLYNATGQNLTIRNNSGSAASGEAIVTMTGADVVTTGNGFAEFIYDTDASPAVWVCKYATA